MTTAANRFRRLMLVLPSFAESPSQSVTELSERLQVPAATLISDLHALAERFDDLSGFAEPVEISLTGDRVELRTDHFLRPMRVSMAELAALELGLGVIANQSEGEIAPLVGETLAQLRQCIASLPQDHRWSGLRSTVLHESGGKALDTLRRALRKGRVVEFEYHRPADEQSASRVVRPYAVLFASGSWYLAGWCESADALRLFRIDRIDELVITDREHQVPDDFSAESLVVNGRPWVSESPPPVMKVRYSSVISRWIAERDGLPLEPDGSAVRTMPLADREWAVRHVLQYGPDAQVIEPDYLQAEIVDRLRSL